MEIKNNDNKIYVDADSVVALVRKNDTNNKKALNISYFLEDNNFTLYTSEFTLSEIINVLSYKVNTKIASNFLKEARKDDPFVILEFNQEVKDLADDYFLKQKENRGVSYFDCINMSFMEIFKINTIFSFDSVYKKNNFLLAEDLLNL